MSDDRIPKQLVYGELTEGKGHKVEGKRVSKTRLESPSSVLTMTQPTVWHIHIKRGAQSYEDARKEKAKRKKEVQTSGTTNATASLHFCHMCGIHF